MEVRNLENLWWHEECLYNVNTFKKITCMREIEKERKNKRVEVAFENNGGIAREEALVSPLIGLRGHAGS
jgi:hypothetical protein